MQLPILSESVEEATDIIRPIYQTENQYSKGEKVTFFTFKAARGKYVALCEGDDYWIDPLKLQKQIHWRWKNIRNVISMLPSSNSEVG